MKAWAKGFSRGNSILVLSLSAAAACSGGGGDEAGEPDVEAAAPDTESTAADEPTFISPDEVPGKVVVNGSFAKADLAMKFADGAIVHVTFGPDGAAAFGEAVPRGAKPRLA